MYTTHLLYLHGFRSSPQSAKARQMSAYVKAHFPSVQLWCPQLPPSPAQAMALLQNGTARWPHKQMAVIGSSLGGYYASALAQHYACPSVMINPAVNPDQNLQKYIGELTTWHDPNERFFFRAEYIRELQAMDVREQIPAAAQLAIIAKGDEVLDWREMSARYPHAQLRLVEGSDHALSDFADHLPAICQFLNLSTAAQKVDVSSAA